MRLLMIDNYDSFTYNLVQYLGELGADVEVFRNDAIGVAELVDRPSAGIVISPGPGEIFAALSASTGCSIRPATRAETPSTPKYSPCTAGMTRWCHRSPWSNLPAR